MNNMDLDTLKEARRNHELATQERRLAFQSLITMNSSILIIVAALIGILVMQKTINIYSLVSVLLFSSSIMLTIYIHLQNYRLSEATSKGYLTNADALMNQREPAVDQGLYKKIGELSDSILSISRLSLYCFTGGLLGLIFIMIGGFLQQNYCECLGICF